MKILFTRIDQELAINNEMNERSTTHDNKVSLAIG